MTYFNMSNLTVLLLGIFLYLLCFNFISLIQITVQKRKIEIEVSTMQQKIAETALLQIKAFSKEDEYLSPTAITEKKRHE